MRCSRLYHWTKNIKYMVHVLAHEMDDMVKLWILIPLLYRVQWHVMTVLICRGPTFQLIVLLIYFWIFTVRSCTNEFAICNCTNIYLLFANLQFVIVLIHIFYLQVFISAHPCRWPNCYCANYRHSVVTMLTMLWHLPSEVSCCLNIV